MSIYIVKNGDNVDSISAATGVSVEDILYANQIPYPYRLAVGQALYIGDESSADNNIQRRAVLVGGYAYPFISRWVLTETLPYLTELLVFSYGFTNEGILVPPLLPDDWMISLAKQYNTRPILTLTPFGIDGRFSNNLTNALVNNQQAIERLTEDILFTLEQKGFVGVDVDFEYTLAKDRDAFTSFVARLRERLNVYGYTVSVCLAPKTSSEQPGLLYQGKDYGGLGAAADSVLLMTYEWGYKYGPPMAVAPINMVRRVVEYAVTEIPVTKMNLGIPNYGYDWPLPYERNVTEARTISNVEAVQIAIANSAEILFDELAKSPYFYYTSNGTEHVVWFEDVRSVQAKFDLINEFGLRGAGYWQIMQLFRANWFQLMENFILFR